MASEKVQAVIDQLNGFTVLDRPLAHGTVPSWLRTLTH